MGINRKDAMHIYKNRPDVLAACSKTLKDGNATGKMKRMAKAFFASLRHMGLDVTEYVK